MNVARFMKRPVVTISPNTPLPEVWKIIFKKHLHSLPVVDKNQKLLGIITKEDLLKKAFPDYNEVIPDFSAGEDTEADFMENMEKLKHVKAKDVMQTHVVFTHPQSSIMRALSRMIVRRVRQLPVLDEEDKLVGLLGKGDVFDSLFRGGKK